MDLETRQLQQLLSAKNQLPEVVLLKATTTSTNDDIREIAQKGITTGLVCSAQQTQGRGQHQRQWISPEGNIYLSTLVQTRTPLDGRLALEVALNILQIPQLQALNLQVKWPNDLYSAQGKWGGILVEPLSQHQAIVGVGINLKTPPVTDSDQPITSLEDLGLEQMSRLELISELYVAIQNADQTEYNDVYDWMDEVFSDVEDKLEGKMDIDDLRMDYGDYVQNYWEKGEESDDEDDDEEEDFDDEDEY